MPDADDADADDDDDDDDERMCFNVAWVRGLQGHVTVTVGHEIVSAVRRLLVRASVRPGKKFSLQSTAENWQW